MLAGFLKKYSRLGCLIFMGMLASCATQKTGTTSGTGTYAEDLSYIRPKFEAEKDTISITETGPVKLPVQIAATHTVNKKVDGVLDSLDKINQLRKFVDGYTIQIYSGQNREEAIAAKSKMIVEVGDEASLQYDQPKFRVTAGRYFTKLEAQKDLMRLRRYFSNAILVPEKILVK